MRLEQSIAYFSIIENEDKIIGCGEQGFPSAIRAHILTSIEEELHKPLSWMRISAVDHQRILKDPSLLPAVDPAPVDAVKAGLELIVHDDAARYDRLSVEDSRSSFANPHILSVRIHAGLPVSAVVCLMVDGEVLRTVSQDLRNEYGEGPFVKAVERLPCLGPDYEGWFKVALTYLWQLVMRAANSGGMDQFLPPKRRATGERPIYNGSWPMDVDMESFGIDPDELAEIEADYARRE
ncbi:uncharacterized protein N7473_012927 [Penicillium subrubescens]|uniref:uncharacterized protein n=1 Tax=Penicillium subrubescens TaxID=1316194 RepID=UPI002545A20B|nr:uncharacterized protein N7473_012927 [Penicillium subrubescens]KAJ5875580.1 hypothetical protein N7473_012927 [Penicillium subrubescens]